MKRGLNRDVPPVRVLSDILASQVAAGEVVERPASVVKELVENSIDAGATSVAVDIEKGGVYLIRVTDDGCGMAREDALLSLERHATSKLRSAADLARIMTLGFRGEAVPSIASVSKFRMITRRREDLTGTEILVDSGKIRDVRDAGGAPGTVIEVRQLFSNMPARRKFLRAETTEAAHVEAQLRLHALAAPGVGFRFRKDDRLVFELPPVGKALDRIRQLVGNELGAELVEIPGGSGAGTGVKGFVLPSRHARKGRRHQFVFLNGRPIEDGAVTKGLAEGFRGSLQEGLHPAAWLWLTVDPGLVDVNVHPAKREVRFHRPHELRDLISRTVAEALRPVPGKAPGRTASSGPAPHGVAPDAPGPAFHPVQPQLVSGSVTTAPCERARKGPDFRIIGMLQERYVLMESGDGLVLFDPKAAHERILYERMVGNAKAGMETQILLVPLLIEMDPRELDLVLRQRMALIEAGLEIDSFGGNTLQVRSLPSCLKVEDPRELVHELLHEMLHGPISSGRFAFDRLARILAANAAKRVEPRLSEVGNLLERLFRCDLPYCAADGRPTLTEYNRKDIDRRFGIGRT